MKVFYCCFLPLLLLTSRTHAGAAQKDTGRVKVAVFIPMYVDTAFDGLNYTLGKGNLPRNIIPGLEFYNGVMMAIDSLNKEGVTADIHIYDTKQPVKSTTTLLASPEMNGIGLVIAALNTPAELKLFGDWALRKNVPLISATYPNYAGVRENPFVVVLNSTLQAHLEGIFRFMQKNYSADTIVAITRKGGAFEDFAKGYVTALNAATSKPLKLKWRTMDEASISVSPLLLNDLDTVKNNVVFIASPMEKFGLDIVKLLSSYEKYKVTAVGMPTWDNIKELDKPVCRNVEIVFSTPFLYYAKNKELSASINSRYKDKFYSRPSDMVFKGYEITYHFTHLLARHKANLINHIGDKDFSLFNEFKLEPVKINKTSIRPDFLENKKLYFIKKQNGVVKAVI